MDPQELAKKLEDMEGQVADLTKRAESSATALAAIKKSADEAGFEVSEDGKLEKRAEPEYVEIDGEKVEKSAVPAPILKRLEDQAGKIEALEKADKETALAKRGSKDLPNLAGSDLAKGKLLEAVGDDEDILKALKAADAAIAKQMSEIGSNPIDDESSATHKLDKMARDHAAEKNVPFEMAYAEITKSGEGARLMVEARKEAN